MSKGYAGLNTQRAESTTEITADVSQPDGSWRAAPKGRYGAFHIVEVERRAPDRIDLSFFKSISANHWTAYDGFKRGLDVVGALLALALLSPLILGIVVISFASGGSPIFKHRRVGKDGVFFDCLKFRTMVPNANEVLQALLDSDRQIKEEWLRHHKLKVDPRVTRLGRFLRRTSLDEVPQLWNVLLGNMSLVGPRPVVPEELRRYGKWVREFLSAPPGITGLWQVSGRNDTDYRRRVALDICYVRSRDWFLDLCILAKTLPAVFAKRGAY